MTDDVTVLNGTEDEVWFVPGQVFTGVSEEWIRPRLRLDPSVGSLDLESEGLNIDLDGELIEDLAQENVFGTGPNDGELAKAETPSGGGGSCAIVGGWLETSAPEICHTFEWIGLDADPKAVLEGWALDCLLIWDEVEIPWTRPGLD